MLLILLLSMCGLYGCGKKAAVTANVPIIVEDSAETSVADEAVPDAGSNSDRQDDAAPVTDVKSDSDAQSEFSSGQTDSPDPDLSESDDDQSDLSSGQAVNPDPQNTEGADKQSDQAPDPSAAEQEQEPAIDRDGVYTSKEDVSLYLHTYGELPDNFITKKEAKALGWPGGGLEEYAPGKCIGGDYFGNYEELLPDADYHECDIDTLGKKSRGAKRIIWDDDGNIYYTGDHYESFEKLY